MHDVLVDTHNPERLNAALWPSLSKCMNVFDCVYSTLNMRKAAQLLHMSLGAISYNIKTLEETLGMKMFARRGRNGLVVTDDGRKLHDYAKQMKTFNKQVVDTFDAVEIDQNVIKIVAHPLAMPMYVMPAIAKVDKSKLDYSIDLSIKSRDDALEDVLSGKADIAVYPLEWSQVSQYQDVVDFVKVAPYDVFIYMNKNTFEAKLKDKDVTWHLLKQLNIEPINKKAQFYTAKNFVKKTMDVYRDWTTNCTDLPMLYAGIKLDKWVVGVGNEFEKMFDCSDFVKHEVSQSVDTGIVTNWFICATKQNGNKTKELVKFLRQEILIKKKLS